MAFHVRDKTLSDSSHAVPVIQSVGNAVCAEKCEMFLLRCFVLFFSFEQWSLVFFFLLLKVLYGLPELAHLKIGTLRSLHTKG